MKKVLFRITGLLIVVAAVWGVYRFFQQLPQRQEQVATAKVRRGDVVIRAFTRGELRAVRSVTLTAPNLFSTVQVTRLAPVGSLAKEKDLVVEFDDSERRAQLEETMLEVEQIDEQIKKQEADLAIRNNQDQVDLLKTRYAVRRAELEVKRNELLSAIDAKKNLLTLEEQRRRLKQLESDIKSRQEQAEAELAVLRANRAKSMIDVNREKQRIAQAKVLSPMTGLVAIKQNRTSFFNFGQAVPDIREGDTLQPGMQVADVLDLSELEVIAKVGELDRANLHEGQDVLISLDAVPDKRFHGKIKGMSGTASANIFSGDPAKKFDVIFSIDMKQLLGELGVKPEQIKKIMETAERNAKKAPAAAPITLSAMMFGGGPGGPGGPVAPGGMQGGMGAPGGEQQGGAVMMPMGAPGGPGGSQEGPNAGGARQFRAGGGGGGGRQGGMGGGMMAGMKPEDAAKFREAMQKALAGKDMRSLSQEERQKIFAQVQEQMKKAGVNVPSRPAGAGGPGAATAATAGQQGEGRVGRRRNASDDDLARFAANTANIGGFSDADREKAQIPLPPEEDSGLEVLLRPGLLADVEIIVEKIPNALHVPAQAVFEREGKQVVYVKRGSRFEPQPIQLAKRSESTMVLAGGVKENDTIALADPNARKGKKDDKKSGGGNAMGAMPGGKK